MSTLSVLVRVSSLLVLLGGGAACTPSSALWSEADAHKEIRVERIQLVHDVPFGANSAEITPQENRRLDEFLARQQVGYGDIVEIRLPGEDARLDARRAAAVFDRLARNGIAAERGTAAAATGIRVAVIRTVAIPPGCADWRKPTGDGDPSNTSMSNLGCSNMRNLGLMIADPSELVVGRPLTAGSGEPLAAGVNRYRAGKVTPLIQDTGTTK